MTDWCSRESRDLLSLEAAREKIAAALRPVSGTEKMALANALGRVLAEPVCAPHDIPYDRNAAVDGYAFCSQDIDKSEISRLRLAGVSWAGQPYRGVLRPGDCIRIFTGAVVPERADSVAMQEFVSVEGNEAVFPGATQTHRFVREIGEDVKCGELLCENGKPLSAIELGLLASAGIYDIRVRRAVTIAFFSTGDELIGVGQPMTGGKIYDSNRYILRGLLAEPCYRTVDMGVIGDGKQLLERALLNAANHHDVIITTGGASVGEADYIMQILEHIGEVYLWKIAMKPGKPLAFGKIGNAFFFGLPGNPVSVAVTFRQVVEPALRCLAGAAPSRPLRIRALCIAPIKKEPGRLEFQRGILTQNEQGEFWVTAAGGQGSHQLGTMAKSNCYIVLPADCRGVAAGEQVIVEPFDHRI